jgi:type III secretion system FlhB-like substrate exporter
VENAWLARTLDKTGRKGESLKVFEKVIINCKNSKMPAPKKHLIYLAFINFLFENNKQKKMFQYVDLFVGDATVVITKGNTIAVTLLYDKETMIAPTVMMLGKDKLAQAIIKTASNSDIPIVENAKVARVLAGEFQPGNVITSPFYEIIASILVAAAAPPDTPPSLKGEGSSPDPLSLEIGSSLIPLVDDDQGAELGEQIRVLREDFRNMSINIPAIRILENLRLKPTEYCVKIRGVEAGRGKAEGEGRTNAELCLVIIKHIGEIIKAHAVENC